jgi:hypothetical protein
VNVAELKTHNPPWLTVFFALAAHAGSIPTYTITQGSIITVGINGFTQNPDVVYQFSGSGFSVVGFGQIVTDFGAALG